MRGGMPAGYRQPGQRVQSSDRRPGNWLRIDDALLIGDHRVIRNQSSLEGA
jgi:hypothetical protein